MSFVTAGLAVAGLIAVAVPIIIHLLSRRRRRPIEWAAMRFLIEAFRKQRRRLQLEQIILLAARCLVLALFGFALARPFLEDAQVLSLGGSRAVIVVIDNGLASGLRTTDGTTALARHVDQAKALVEGLRPADAVGLVTAARPAEIRLSPPSTRHAAVTQLLDGIEPGDAATDLPAALSVVRQAVDDAAQQFDQVVVYLLSDYRRGSARLDAPLAAALEDLQDTVTLLSTAPATETIDNVQITAIDPVRRIVLAGAADGSGQVTVRLARSGGELGRQVTEVRLTGDGIATLPTRQVNWQPGEAEAEVDFLVRFPVARDREVGLTASIGDDALNADNERHVVIEQRNEMRVVLIDQRPFGFQPTLDRLAAGQWIRRALEPMDGSPVEVVEVEPAALELADLRMADVAVLPRPDLLSDDGWMLLRRFVDAGGVLAITPPGEINVHRWVSHLEDDLQLPWSIGLEIVEHDPPLTMADDQPDSELLRLISSELGELTRPVTVQRSLPIDTDRTQATPVLTLADGTPLLIQGSPRSADGAEEDVAGKSPAPTSRGQVVYMATSPQLDWTNLPAKPLMVPLFQEIVRQGSSLNRATLNVLAGDRPSFGLTSGASDLRGPEGEVIPLDPSGRPHAALARSGVYQVLDAGRQPVETVAVNVEPAAGESSVQGRQDVLPWLHDSGPWEVLEGDDLHASLRRAGSATPLAGLLLMAVLLLVVVETALARWFSHARGPGRGEAPRGFRPTIVERVSGGYAGTGAS